MNTNAQTTLSYVLTTSHFLWLIRVCTRKRVFLYMRHGTNMYSKTPVGCTNRTQKLKIKVRNFSAEWIIPITPGCSGPRQSQMWSAAPFLAGGEQLTGCTAALARALWLLRKQKASQSKIPHRQYYTKTFLWKPKTRTENSWITERASRKYNS